VRDWEIAVDDVDVHTVSWTPARARPRATPLLLIHGLGGSTINWELVGQGLADRAGARVDAVDLPGFGRSRLGSARATVGANGAVVARLLAEWGPAVLVGNSMGGAISIGVAARHPDLVPGLVLVDPALPRRGRGSLRPVMQMPAAVAAFVRSARGRGLSPALLADAALQMVFHDPEALDREVLDRLALLAYERGHYEERRRALREATQSLISHTARPSGLWRDMRSVHCPVLVIQGRQDRLVPLAVIREAVRHRADWHLEVFDRCGHVPQLEMPEQFVDVVIDFVTREVAAPPAAAAEA